MRNIIWFVALFLLLLLTAGILVPLRIAPVNLILVTVVMAVILSDFNQGLVIALVGGLLLDFASGFPDGMISISLLAVFLLMHFVLNEILSREPNGLIMAASIIVATVLFFLAFIAVDRMFGLFDLAQKPDLGFLLDTKLPLTIMWNLVFAYSIFRFYLFVQNLASKLPHGEESIKV